MKKFLIISGIVLLSSCSQSSDSQVSNPTVSENSTNTQTMELIENSNAITDSTMVSDETQEVIPVIEKQEASVSDIQDL